MHEPAEFKTDDEIKEPNGFEPLSPVDWTVPATRETFYIFEIIQYWYHNDENPYVDLDILVLGYVKKVFRAKLTEDNKLLFDTYGHPIFRPNKDLGVLH